MNKCLVRHVQIVIKGQATTITLAPGFFGEGEKPSAVPPRILNPWGQFSAKPASVTPFIRPQTPFWLRPVLFDSKLVLASSDLSRVKVTRRDPKTGKNREWVVDCRGSFPESTTPDLWLRDGDVIEVPDK